MSRGMRTTLPVAQVGVTEFEFDTRPVAAATGPWSAYSRLPRKQWGTGGVYVLIGRHGEGPALRPGESNDLRRRLGEHARKPPIDEVERFVVFRRIGRTFNSAEYGCLEGLLHQLDDLVDWDFPGAPNDDQTLTKEQREDLEELFKDMLKVLVMLGVPVVPPAAAVSEAVYDLLDAEPPAYGTQDDSGVAVRRLPGPVAPLESEALFFYSGFGGAGGLTHLRIFRPEDRRPVVVAGALEDNPGTSITNAAETLAAEVVGHYPEVEEAVLVEFWPDSAFGGSHYHRLDLERRGAGSDLHFANPKWTPISEDGLRDLTDGAFSPLEIEGGYDQAWVGTRLAKLGH